jgi:hypothetical protein
MADFLQQLIREPDLALKGLKPTNPILKDIFNCIPENERRGVVMPERGHALKMWLEEWARNKQNGGGAASEPAPAPPAKMPTSPSRAQQQQQPQQNQWGGAPQQQNQRASPQQQRQQQRPQFLDADEADTDSQPIQHRQQSLPQRGQQQQQQPNFQQTAPLPQQRQQQQQQGQQQQWSGPPQPAAAPQRNRFIDEDEEFDQPPSHAHVQRGTGGQQQSQGECAACKRKDQTIAKLTKLVQNLLEQQEDVIMQARGDLTLVLES